MTGLLYLLLVACSALADPVNRQFIPAQNAVSDNTISARNSRQNDESVYYLYTRLNPKSAQTLVINDVNSITSSNFDDKKTVVVVIHGWVDNTDSDFNGAIRDAYLQKADVNIIMVDWGTVARALYGQSVNGVPRIADGLAQFLAFLTRVTGASLANTHLVGFSLGAHVAGLTGRALGGKVARITGLDPAGPLWYGNSNRLSSSDAVYVEAIHTDASLLGLGITEAVGDVDFFPNGGHGQPGCWDMFCNHNRAWQMYAATVTYDNFIGSRCDNMFQVSLNNCRGDQLPMGNINLHKRGSGLYRLNTKAAYPYF